MLLILVSISCGSSEWAGLQVLAGCAHGSVLYFCVAGLAAEMWTGMI